MSKNLDHARASPSATRYIELIHEFPLRPIRTEDELDRAIAVVDSLLDRAELIPDEQDYLDVLGDLIEKYESSEHPLVPATDAELLRHLIDARGVTQAEVASDAGIAESTISEILTGRRTLNRKHIAALAKLFHVSPAVFMSTTRK